MAALFASMYSASSWKRVTEAQQEVIEAQEERIAILEEEHKYWVKYNVPHRYYHLAKKEAFRLGLDLDFMVALMKIESNFNKDATSHKLARGLMQVQWTTAAEVDGTLVSYWQLYKPEVNIRIGMEYFRALLDQYDGDYDLASMAYNYGPTRFDELFADGSYSTRYVRLIRRLLD